MAHHGSSAPLLYTNGAPVGDAPLVWKTLMAYQKQGVPLVLTPTLVLSLRVPLCHRDKA